MIHTLEELKPGDWVTRMMDDPSVTAMRIQVTAVVPSDGIIVCGQCVFDMKTGREITEPKNSHLRVTR